jgi:hypothetical protein
MSVASAMLIGVGGVFGDIKKVPPPLTPPHHSQEFVGGGEKRAP